MSEYTITKGKTYFEAKQYAKKGMGSWFSKLGNSLVAVVVVLPVAGLFAAIGGIIMSKGTNQASYTAGLIFSDLGQTVLSNLGLLFMLAILLGFTDRKGYALFSAIIGYIAFVGFITPFISYKLPVKLADGTSSNSPADAQYFSIWFWKNLEVKTQLTNIFGLGQAAWGINPAHDLKGNGQFARLSYQGFTTLNTGVLGGIVLGFVDVWIYKKGKDVKLPNMLAFFGGEKFVSVIALLAAPVVACLFIIIWPAINIALEQIGKWLSVLPYGIDAGIFGVLKQLLIPFEAHQALIAPLWYTPAGGQLSAYEPDVVMAMMYRIAENKSIQVGQDFTFMDGLKNWINSKSIGSYKLYDVITDAINTDHVTLDNLLSHVVSPAGAEKATVGKLLQNLVTTDQYNEISSTLNKYKELDWTISGDQLMTFAVFNNPDININDFWSAGLKITRFITGGYANLMFLTPAVGMAMWATLSKDARKRKMGFYFGAALPSFVLGVNEPIIFMFAYTAPFIYYVAYSGICGILFLFTALFQAKLSSTFSQGLLDYVVNGIMPTATRGADGASQTMLWVPLVIGVITFALGFVFFRWLFIKQEFVAPGMEEGIDNNNKGQSVYTKTKPLVTGFVDYFGGLNNIKSLQWEGQVLKVEPKDTFEYKKNDYSDKLFDQVIVSKDNVVTLVLQEKNYDFVRAINYVATLVAVKNAKKVKLTNKAKQQQKISKVEAKWQIKHDSLDTTSDIEKATAVYKEKLWALKNSEANDLLKAKGKKPKPLSEKTKVEVKKLTKDYKKQIKELKAINKQKIKAERGIKAKSKKTK